MNIRVTTVAPSSATRAIAVPIPAGSAEAATLGLIAIGRWQATTDGRTKATRGAGVSRARPQPPAQFTTRIIANGGGARSMSSTATMRIIAARTNRYNAG